MNSLKNILKDKYMRFIPNFLPLTFFKRDQEFEAHRKRIDLIINAQKKNRKNSFLERVILIEKSKSLARKIAVKSSNPLI